MNLESNKDKQFQTIRELTKELYVKTVKLDEHKSNTTVHSADRTNFEFLNNKKKKYNLDSEQKIEGITAKLVSLEAANKFQISENERLPCSHKVGDLSMLLLRQNNKVNIVCN